MGTFADDWKRVLDDFQSSVTKDLEEIRQHKAEIQSIRKEIEKGINLGLYYRDDKRLIISAPEVIIGNIDESGMLMPGYSTVTIRANKVDLEGVGEAGKIQTRAASIRHTAIDPGIDGKEEVVRAMSEVVSQATNIVLESNDAEDVFSKNPVPAGRGGIRIHSDGQLQLEASITADQHKSALDAKIKELEASKSVLEKTTAQGKKTFEALAKKVQQILDEEQKLTKDENDIRTDYNRLDILQDQFTVFSQSLAQATSSWASSISSLAEVNRQLTALKAEKGDIITGDKYKKESTGSCVSITGERIDLISADGEGNLRDNEGSGVGIYANEVTISSCEADKSLKKEGNISISAKTLNLNTVNPTELQYNDKGEVNSGKYPAEGDVFIRSKNITLEAVDNKVADSKTEEEALTKDGRIALRAEKMDFSATDTEGKATGSIGINSKAISIRSMDVDKEKREDNKLAAGSNMLLLSEKMFIGAKDKDNKSKNLQAVSDEMGLFAEKTIEAQQGDAKAVVQLSGGNASISGSKTQLYGATTINGKTEVKDELKAPQAKIDNLEAKSSFKSSNISDGIAVPGAPSNASLSAKLKKEDAPKEK